MIVGKPGKLRGPKKQDRDKAPGQRAAQYFLMGSSPLEMTRGDNILGI